MTDRLEQLTKLHGADPSDPFCTYGIAMEHAKANRCDEAIIWLDKTITLDPQYCYAFYQKARLLSEDGRTDDARQVIQIGLEAALQTGDDHAHSEMLQLLESFD